MSLLASFKILCKDHLQNKTIWVGYSGGIDSHVLLHLAHATFSKVQAVHIHHGLSPNADQWQAHCESVCATLQIPLLCVRVKIQKEPQQSLEDAARIARRSAWKNMLGADDVLLLAHHAQDQAETILYRLIRGAGPKGLSGMRQVTQLGAAQICRPLLNVTKQQILQHASVNRLHAISDESNLNQKFDRNYIRNAILPLIQQRWPRAIENINRAGELNYNLVVCLQPAVEHKLASICVDDLQALDTEKLLQHDSIWQIELLRAWLQKNSLTPTYKQIMRILNEVIGARIDAQPQLAINAKIICRYKQTLYIMHKSQTDASQQDKYVIDWDVATDLITPDGLVISSKQVFANQKSIDTLSARKMRVFSIAHGRKAKKIFQKFAVPVWLRTKYPAIYADDELVAIVGLWSKTLAK